MEGSRAIEPSDRLRLAPSATRRLGPDLLVSAGGATRPVERLTGSGPELWNAFGAGLTVGEAAARLAQRTGAALTTVEPHVLEFAEALVRAQLAERSP
ncbi:MAG TPA: PqqD family protein [Acidimicrobiales bacterium]|nr:PqqD family protein [Acidimicrobiales bacterium]